MKRLLSFILIFSLVFPISAYALNGGNDSVIQSNDEIVFISSGNGTYTPLNANAIPETANIIYATPTNDAETYHIKDNHYLIQAYDNQFVPADQIIVNTTDFSQNEKTFGDYHVPNEVIETIQSDIEEQNALGNDKFRVSLFAPRYDDNSWWETEYSFRTHRLKKYVTKYEDASTPWLGVADSPDALDVASAMTQLTVIIGGVFNEALGIFGGFTDALNLFLELTGKQSVTGGNHDEAQVKVWYDKRKERTFVYNAAAGGWSMGCEADKVWLNKSDTTLSFDGETVLDTHNINKTKYTPKFNDSSNVAVDNFSAYGYVDPPVEVRIANYNAIL